MYLHTANACSKCMHYTVCIHIMIRGIPRNSGQGGPRIEKLHILAVMAVVGKTPVVRVSLKCKGEGFHLPPPPPPQIVIPTCSTSILDVILHCSSVRTLAHNLGNIWLVELGILQCSLWRVQTINFRGTVAGEFEKKRNRQYSCASECVVGGGGGGGGYDLLCICPAYSMRDHLHVQEKVINKIALKTN